MYNVGIIGIGFLGGSLARSFSKSQKVKDIVAFDKNLNSLKSAYYDGVITDYTNKINEKFSNCDIIFICTPVSYIAEYALELKKYVKKECIITDTGSTKKTILEKTKNLNINFIGGHPMIGSEKSGYATSKDLLFENSYYIITKSVNTSEESLKILKELIFELKANPIIIDEEKHDYITATISHIPHIVAAALVNLAKRLDDGNVKTLAAGGFKDITRIASASPTIWENICAENKDEIIKVLEYLITMLKEIEDNIEKGNNVNIYNFFEEAKKYRDSFIDKK